MIMKIVIMMMIMMMRMMNDDDIIHRFSIIIPHMYKSSSILTCIAYLKLPWSMCSSSTATKRTRGSQPDLSYHIIAYQSNGERRRSSI